MISFPLQNNSLTFVISSLDKLQALVFLDVIWTLCAPCKSRIFWTAALVPLALRVWYRSRDLALRRRGLFEFLAW